MEYCPVKIVTLQFTHAVLMRDVLHVDMSCSYEILIPMLQVVLGLKACVRRRHSGSGRIRGLFGNLLR
jgi:hypothetical protein